MVRNFVVAVRVLKGGAIGDRQEILGVAILDLLMLGQHSKTGAVEDNDDCTGTFSCTLMLES